MNLYAKSLKSLKWLKYGRVQPMGIGTGFTTRGSLGLVKPVRMHLAALFHMSVESAITAISDIILGEFQNYIIYKPQDGEFNISFSDQSCCVCACPSRVPGRVCVLSVPQCGPIV